MSQLPDRFDLWVRKARLSADPSRQADWVLGALVARDELFFLNIGTRAKPLIAKAVIAPDECALMFTDADRLVDFAADFPAAAKALDEGPPVIASPTSAALTWCVENGSGLVINPGSDETPLVPVAELAKFVEAWRASGERLAAGFWIPGATTEEEEFWQENGL